jgi:hypothetical protein
MEQEAIKKITESMQECKEKRVPAEPIARYLTGKCGGDGEFCALVMQEQKTLEKCFSFVYEQVKNHLNGNNGWISDNDVYMMALDYFYLDDAELERQKAEEEAKREQERVQREAERARRTAEFKNAPSKKTEDEQISLFDEGE